MNCVCTDGGMHLRDERLIMIREDVGNGRSHWKVIYIILCRYIDGNINCSHFTDGVVVH